jgi:hypothetical protein
MENQSNNSKVSLWSGRILKGLIITFLIFDAAMKIAGHPKYVEGTLQLGLPESCVFPLGVYLLLSTIMYLVPRTVLMGGLFLTAYLGGAAAITYAADNNGHPYLFPVIFTVILWLAEFLRNEKIRSFLPLTK